MALRVLVCGGRKYADALTLGSWLGGIHGQHTISLIIEGGATGADRLARHFGEWKCIPVKTFKANWEKEGPAAGPIRNKRMIDEGKPDLVVAFPGGRGTQNMVKQSRDAGIRVLEVTGGVFSADDRVSVQ